MLFTFGFGQNYSLHFDEDSNKVILPDISIQENGTILVWFKVDQVLQTFATVIDKGWHPESTGFSVWIDQNTIIVGYHPENSPLEYLSSEIPVNDNEWHNVAFTWSENSGKRLYVDGQINSDNQIDTNVELIIDNDNNFYIGYALLRDYGFKGNLSTLLFYDIALEQNTIQNIVSNTIGLYESDLIGFWPINEGEGDIVNDYSGNNYQGTIEGATWTTDHPCINWSVVDECGVCGGDNTANTGTCDCAGVPSGDSLEDNCGMCDNDPLNDCVLDCAGNWGGGFVNDECGVCDDDVSNDCVLDCAGNWGGGFVNDECGLCGGDNTSCADQCGVPNGDNTSCADCNGDPNGIAYVDECGFCSCGCGNDVIGEFGSGNCVDTDFDNIPDTCEGGYYNGTQDCDLCSLTGWSSSEFINMCGYWGECYSLINPELDEEGQGGLDEYCNQLDDIDACNNHPYCYFDDTPYIANSDFCTDCAGVLNGDSSEDNCGMCDNDPLNDCVQDCDGTWGGSLEVDECGICDGDNIDMDCNEECFGDAIEDCDGVCGGNNFECGTCDNSHTSLYFDNNAYINLPSNYQIEDNGSVFVWFKCLNNIPFNTIIDKGWHDYSTGFSIWIDGSGILQVGYHPENSSSLIYLSSEIPVNDNQWHNVAFTWSANNGKRLYVDGQIYSDNQIDLNPAQIIDNEINFILGQSHDRSYPLLGNLSTLKLYDNALSEVEIQYLSTFLYFSEEGLIGDWSMTEGSGNTIYDYSGNNGDSFINGAFWVVDYPCYCNECGMCDGDNSICNQDGDLNNDGQINVLDVVMLVDIILNNGDYNISGDLVSDGILNVLDIVAIVGIILNP